MFARVSECGYGPLVAGPEGATALVIFADSNWEGIPLGKGQATPWAPTR